MKTDDKDDPNAEISYSSTTSAPSGEHADVVDGLIDMNWGPQSIAHRSINEYDVGGEHYHLLATVEPYRFSPSLNAAQAIALCIGRGSEPFLLLGDDIPLD